MNLRRIFANAIARRVAYVVVAAALAWFGLGDARAQTYQCLATPNACTRQDAYTEAVVRRNELMAIHTTAQFRIVDGIVQPSPVARYQVQYRWGTGLWTNPESPTLFYWSIECAEGYFWDDENNTCGQPCQGLDPLPAGNAQAPGSGDRFCEGDCAYSCSTSSITLTIDGVMRTVCAGPWNPTGSTCSAGDPPPLVPVTDSDGDGSSDENDLSPNNPGESGDGTGQDGSKACGAPGQPECAPDGSNEGSGKGNTSGGGGDCNTPPSSSGDAILAQIAFQTWATRCAVTANANKKPGPGQGGDGDQPEWTKGEGPEPTADDTDYVSDQTRFGLPVSTDLLNQENIFGAASCEHFSIPIWRGTTVSTSDFDGWCTLQTILRGLITIFGAFTAIQILLGKW